MTVLAMEMAASSRSHRWPAKAWVMTSMQYEAARLKIAGPTMCHNFFDSIQDLFAKSSRLIFIIVMFMFQSDD
ncbi:hypothetical protein ACFX2I_018952 [Malus domestica]